MFCFSFASLDINDILVCEITRWFGSIIRVYNKILRYSLDNKMLPVWSGVWGVDPGFRFSGGFDLKTRLGGLPTIWGGLTKKGRDLILEGGFRNLSSLWNPYIKSFEKERSPEKMLDYFSLIVKKNPTKTINKKAYELNITLFAGNNVNNQRLNKSHTPLLKMPLKNSKCEMVLMNQQIQTLAWE